MRQVIKLFLLVLCCVILFSSCNGNNSESILSSNPNSSTSYDEISNNYGIENMSVRDYFNKCVDEAVELYNNSDVLRLNYKYSPAEIKCSYGKEEQNTENLSYSGYYNYLKDIYFIALDIMMKSTDSDFYSTENDAYRLKNGADAELVKEFNLLFGLFVSSPERYNYENATQMYAEILYSKLEIQAEYVLFCENFPSASLVSYNNGERTTETLFPTAEQSKILEDLK